MLVSSPNLILNSDWAFLVSSLNSKQLYYSNLWRVVTIIIVLEVTDDTRDTQQQLHMNISNNHFALLQICMKKLNLRGYKMQKQLKSWKSQYLSMTRKISKCNNSLTTNNSFQNSGKLITRIHATLIWEQETTKTQGASSKHILIVDNTYQMSIF